MPWKMRVAFDPASSQVSVGDAEDPGDVDQKGSRSLVSPPRVSRVLDIGSCVVEELAFYSETSGMR